MNNELKPKENPMNRGTTHSSADSILFCALALVAAVAVVTSLASMAQAPTWRVVDSARAGNVQAVQTAEKIPQLLVAQSR